MMNSANRILLSTVLFPLIIHLYRGYRKSGQQYFYLALSTLDKRQDGGNVLVFTPKYSLSCAQR